MITPRCTFPMQLFSPLKHSTCNLIIHTRCSHHNPLRLAPPICALRAPSSWAMCILCPAGHNVGNKHHAIRQNLVQDHSQSHAAQPSFRSKAPLTRMLQVRRIYTPFQGIFSPICSALLASKCLSHKWFLNFCQRDLSPGNMDD